MPQLRCMQKFYFLSLLVRLPQCVHFSRIFSNLFFFFLCSSQTQEFNSFIGPWLQRFKILFYSKMYFFTYHFLRHPRGSMRKQTKRECIFVELSTDVQKCHVVFFRNRAPKVLLMKFYLTLCASQNLCKQINKKHNCYIDKDGK